MAYKVSNNPSGTAHMISAINDKYEPQRTNNFELQIVGLGPNNSKAIMLSVASYSAPQINVNPIEVSYGNNVVKYAGKPQFPESTITLNDFIGLDIEQAITAWQKQVYDPDSETVGRARNYKKTGYLIEYSPDGDIYRSWRVDGCWPSSVQLGQFDQSNSSVRQITVTLQYDRVVPATRGKKLNISGATTGAV